MRRIPQLACQQARIKRTSHLPSSPSVSDIGSDQNIWVPGRAEEDEHGVSVLPDVPSAEGVRLAQRRRPGGRTAVTRHEINEDGNIGVEYPVQCPQPSNVQHHEMCACPISPCNPVLRLSNETPYLLQGLVLFRWRGFCIETE